MAARNPEDCDRLFGEGINAGDAAAVAALYERDAVLLLDGERHVGPDAIRPVLEGWIATKPVIALNVTQVIRAGEDLAVLYNDWRVTITDAQGKQSTGSGKAIEIVRRQADGSWKFIVDDPRARG
ncbi:MAG: SgcJ/EcaC family oxidoreductase [Thermodesulfobacteriota bacterium]